MLGDTVEITYAYDADGRLAAVTADGAAAVSWTYDPNGNRVTETTPSETVAASYDGQDRLVAFGETSYAFGRAGQLASKSGPEGTTSYDYDALGNLRPVALADGTAISYEVDGAGRRVGRRVDGVLQRAWLYQDALEPVAELDASGAVVSVFVYGNRTHVPDAMVRGGTTYRILSDHLGSVRMVVNAATGAVEQRLDYDAWGRVLTDTNPGFQPFGFAGGLYDPETGLVRFGARDYDATTGRWTARDPILFQGRQSNLFAYAGNDPVNRVDLTGLEELPECIAGYLDQKFNTISVTEVDFHEGIPWWANPWTDPKTVGFILGDNVYLKEGEYDPTTRDGVATIYHELLHVEQYQKVGKIEFLKEYLRQRREANREGKDPDTAISIEKDAYKAEKEFRDHMNSTFGTEGPCGYK
ncbi:MAG: DUF4157 domain-containing protein [Candidatus Schekmanbacteria bacterium]|nr:DUF4157 domain-containing protein [Candidatus Schekmanbacteria bacterium]